MRPAVVYVKRIRHEGNRHGRHAIRSGSNTVAHLNPLCPHMARADRADYELLALPARVDGGTAITRGVRLPLCKSCAGWQLPDMRWHQRGLCFPAYRHPALPGDLWFRPGSRSRRLAARICAHCPVRHDCLAYALAEKMPDGMWGGVRGRALRAAISAHRAEGEAYENTA